MVSGAEQRDGGSLGSVYFVCAGTRGDQQPLVMIAARMKQMGYDAVLCVGREGRGWVEEFGFKHIEFNSFEAIVQSDKQLQQSSENGNFSEFLQRIAAVLGENTESEITAVWSAISNDPKAVGVLASSGHFCLAEVLARKLDICCAAVFFSPFNPTAEFPPYMIDTRNPKTWQELPAPDGTFPYQEMQEPPAEAYRDLWMGLLTNLCTMWIAVLKGTSECCDAAELVPKDDDKILRMLLSLMAPDEVPVEEEEMRVRAEKLLLLSPSVINGAQDVSEAERDKMLGFVYDICDPKYGGAAMSPFDEKMERFLEAGEEPVYLGWGSMCRLHNEEVCRAAVEACMIAGKRGVILGGWAQLSLDMLDPDKDAELIEYAKEKILFTKKANHILLFPRCCCVVTHGGAGTSAATFRSGKPGIITPVWWDQNFFGDRFEAIGNGLRGPHFGKLNGPELAELITKVTTDPSYTEAAIKIRDEILSKDFGDVMAADRMHARIEAKKTERKDKAPAAAVEPPLPPKDWMLRRASSFRNSSGEYCLERVPSGRLG